MSTRQSEHAGRDPSRQLLHLIWPGALGAQAIHAAATLGVADHLSGEPRTVAELAAATGTAAVALDRLLRALTSLGIFAETEQGRFIHTAMSETLRSDHPASTRAWARMLGAHFIWRPWGELTGSVRTGETAFDQIFGTTFYDYLASRPDAAAIYDEAMNSGAALTARTIVEAYDFSPFKRIVDVGGGRGGLLNAILKAQPEAHGTLFDLPRVVSETAALQNGDLGDRCRVEAGSFFDTVPAGDCHLLKGIVHAFADKEALQLLQNCRRSIKPDGRLLIVEAVPEARGEASPQKAMMDLMMVTLVAGLERTEAQFTDLLQRAGFELMRVVPTNGPSAIVEARPV